jgi:hypothetical protein
MLVVVVLAACNPQAPQELPTIIPENTAIPTTEIPAQSAEVTPTATVTPPRARPTLPPTWTPLPSETPLPTETETPLPTPTFFQPTAALPEGCNVFQIDFERSSRDFRIGTAPTVYWVIVPEAVRYRVTLRTFQGVIIKDDIYLAETQYTFAADLFEQGVQYGWEVYPINALGDQMCFQRGGELYPVIRLGN